MSHDINDLRKTPFHSFHVASGAKMVDFGGWHMPLQYEGILKEHHCVRSKVGLFDVSHMGEITLKGARALEAARVLVTNGLGIDIGQAQYSPMCNHEGGIIDDLIVYRRSENNVLICVNASNREKDFAWIVQNNPFPGEVEVINESDSFAQIAVQGRHAEALLQKLCDMDLSAVRYYHFVEGTCAGVEGCILARTGYTGEDGFEVFLPAAGADVMWPAILDAGSEFGLAPIGLGARDSLRLEAKMHLYGSDMTEKNNPYEAALGWAVQIKKEHFIGKEALIDYRKNHWTHRMVGMKVEGRIPRPGCPVLLDGRKVGVVTSGTKSPVLGYGVAMAYIEKPLSKIGTELHVDVRGRTATAKVVKGAFYRRDY
jgi:aminomethyltransferase